MPLGTVQHRDAHGAGNGSCVHPAIGTATAGNAQATVNWTAPASNGGSAITGYSVRVVTGAANAQVGALRPAAAGATSLVVTGLANGTAVRFQVSATNAVGTSLLSALSNAVTPTAPTLTAPGAPSIGAAVCEQRLGHRQLDGTGKRRWQRHHRLLGQGRQGIQQCPGRRTSSGSCRRDQPGGHGSDQRNRIPVPGQGDQQRWQWSLLGTVRIGHSCHHAERTGQPDANPWWQRWSDHGERQLVTG